MPSAGPSTLAEWRQLLMRLPPEGPVPHLDEAPYVPYYFVRPKLTVEAALKMLRERLEPELPPAPEGCRRQEHVVYGIAGVDGRPLTLHLYSRPPGSRAPGVVFIHGGAWQSGFPLMMARLAQAAAADGYVAATISYRLAGEATWPAQLEDAKCAVRWMRAHAAQIGLDSERLAAAGASAGGHLAALLAMTPGQFEGSGGWTDESSAVRAVVLYCPALDVRAQCVDDPRMEQAIEALLGHLDEDARRAISPICHVSAACPPVATRIGDKDPVTPAAASEAFHTELTKAGVPNRLEVVPGYGHAIQVSDFEGSRDFTLEALADFLPTRV